MPSLTLNSDQIESAKSSIIDRFFHNALWIDDSIIDDIDKTGYEESLVRTHFDFFVKLTSFLATKGIACALKGYMPDNPDFEELEIEKCSHLAGKADIVFLDWHLSDNSPKSAIEIIRKLAQLRGFRIIILITKVDNPLETLIKDLNYETSDEWITNKGGLYVTYVKKEEVNATGNNADIFWEKIRQKLLKITDNILSWIALETAAEIKDNTPRWLSILPSQIEFAACLHQHSSGDTTSPAGDIILQNLLDDLTQLISKSNISIASNDIFKFANIKDGNLLQDLARELENYKQDHNAVYENNKKHFNRVSKGIQQQRHDSTFSNALYTVLSALRHSDLQLSETIKDACNSCEHFTSFCECVSSENNEAACIQKGNIYVQNTSDNTINICISQECDCVRATFLIFLKATQTNNYRENKPHFYFNNNLYNITLDGNSIISREIEQDDTGRRTPKDWIYIGRLRKPIVDKLTHDFWKHITRVGVDTPEFERSLRHDKKTL